MPWGSWRSTPPDDSAPPEESLAAARRAGLALSRAEYVRFIEATDTTPAGATAALLTRLRRSGAPTAAGVSERIDATWRDRAHRPAPEVALDLGARLFRVVDEVLEALDFEPVHGRFADAMLAGLDVATIPDVVHHDHHREHGLPFGHLPRRAAEVRALAAVVEDTTRKLAEELVPAWAAGLLDRRLPSLVEDVESFDGETWDALRRTTQRLVDLADLTAVRVEARLQAWLVAEGRRDDLTALVLRRWREPDDFPTHVDAEGRITADFGVEAPVEVLTLDERETPLWATVRHADAGAIDLVVIVRGVPSGPDDRVTLHAGGHVIEAEPSGDEHADRIAAESWTDHRAGGWRLRVTEADLAGELEYRSGAVVRRGPLPAVPSSPKAGPRLTALGWDGESATLTISTPGQVTVTGPGGEVSGTTDGDGTVVLRLVVDVWGLGERPLPLGGYELRLDGRPVAADPLELRGGRHRLTVRESGGTARLVLDDLRGPDEVGPHAQRRLQQEYAAVTEPVDPGLAYFQSYTGQWPTDSPLAIHESLRRQRPDVRVRWCVDDPGVPLPDGAEPVLIRSREWYDTLARARWIVTNIEMERWFRRRPEQRLLQTWHGNPGKVMGLGLWRANGLTPGRIEQNLDHGPRNWTLLMSPSPEMTEHYRREFAYDGPVVDQGYARDDALLAPSAPHVRAESRRRLGIGDDQAAVLYAPTWRDTMATNYRAARLQDDLDLARLADLLGPAYVVLLRGHRFHARHPERPRGARILDVTDYPEINHLILAADVAVLDYSSLRFDIGVVGTPMVFMVPDLAAYEEGRGFLYDFRSSAPGPLLATTEDVATALRDLEALRRVHAADYAAFQARFHAGQDGHAADRAVSAFFD
ncbi:CDP-glycerol glycerophosphotransferase family protein [Marmoricola sp. URHB0036]|uniref:CDP-glycerol glycerophosphotransferase family protein n=1 Tax=Marmoricola sp. URHB0036 TaxID=1298863 RepID=UPI0003FD1101|nr:CDP-glycerol glycerophosphotransferase family protein [Marmoricola sp. URHB0036]